MKTIVIFQIIGLIALLIISFAVSSLILGIHTAKKRLDMMLFCMNIFLIFTSVNSLFFAGWVAVFNITNLHNIHTFRSSFQTLHFVIYLVTASILLPKPLSILMDKSKMFIEKLQWRLEDRWRKNI